MTKTLQNSINTKEERIIHLNLENKVLKSMNDQLKERNIKLKEDSCTQLRIITDQSRLVQEMSVTCHSIFLRDLPPLTHYPRPRTGHNRHKDRLPTRIERANFQIQTRALETSLGN